jgi:tetratricopeptide (TPR) repeat protein
MIKIFLFILLSAVSITCNANIVTLNELNGFNKLIKGKTEEQQMAYDALTLEHVHAISGMYKIQGPSGDQDSIGCKATHEIFEEIAQTMPIGWYMLGYMYQSGWCVECSKERSDHYYNVALQKGSIDSKYILALEKYNALTMHIALKNNTYEEAVKTYEEGKKLLIEVADEGHDFGQIAVATMYINGELAYKDYDNAKKYINRAIKENKADGHAALGAMYSDMGKAKEALKYLKLAVAEGSAIAPIILAQNYVCGTGVEKDMEAAHKYQELAIKNGARNFDLEEINIILKDGCIKPFDSDDNPIFSYTAKDAMNDYFSRNRFYIGIIPSVMKAMMSDEARASIPANYK